MDKSEAIKNVQRYLLNVAGKYQIENAIIFGSYAKGSASWDKNVQNTTAWVQVFKALLLVELKSIISIHSYKSWLSD